MSPKTRGFTLTEVLVALVLLGVVVIAISNLEITRGKMGQTTEALIAVQREATEALEHIQKRVMTAYYIWFDKATPQANVVWFQSIDPSKVNEPPDPAKIKESPASSPDPNWGNFKYSAYKLEGNQLIFYENIIPGTLSALPSQTVRRTIVCKNVSAWSMDWNDPPDPPGQPLLHTGVVFQVEVTDPQTGKKFSIGPVEMVSRSMGAARPTGWRPPKPPGTPAI